MSAQADQTVENGSFRPIPSRCLERCQPVFFEKDDPLQVIARRFEVQREGGAHDAQASHEFSTHLRQRAEHMLGAGARGGDTAVAPFLRGRNTFAGGPGAEYGPASRPV